MSHVLAYCAFIGAATCAAIGAVVVIAAFVLALYWLHCGVCLARDRAVSWRISSNARRMMRVTRHHQRRDAAAFGPTEEGC